MGKQIDIYVYSMYYIGQLDAHHSFRYVYGQFRIDQWWGGGGGSFQGQHLNIFTFEGSSWNMFYPWGEESKIIWSLMGGIQIIKDDFSTYGAPSKIFFITMGCCQKNLQGGGRWKLKKKKNPAPPPLHADKFWPVPYIIANRACLPRHIPSNCLCHCTVSICVNKEFALKDNSPAHI